MPTKRYRHKRTKKTRKIQRGGVKGRKSTISLKSLNHTMDDLFGKPMKQASRNQPSRRAKSNTLARLNAVKQEILDKEARVSMKKKEKNAFDATMNSLADKLERVLR